MNSSRAPSLSKRFLFILLITVSASCTAYYLYNWLYNKQALAFTSTPPPASPIQAESNQAPTHIKIPRVHIDVALEKGSIHENIWNVSEFYGNYLVTSATPGSNGNVVLYGHNTPQIFGHLLEVRAGDTVEIESSNGNIHTYRVTNTFITSPDNISVVSPTNTEQLTIYTCTGWHNTKRFIVQAEPIFE